MSTDEEIAKASAAMWLGIAMVLLMMISILIVGTP